MQVIRTNSWQSQLGNLLGTLVGANYQEKDMDRRWEKMENRAIALENYKNATQEDFLKNNPDLAAAIQNPNIPDEDWDNLGNKYGFDVSQFKGISNIHRNITQDGIGYNAATTDEDRAMFSRSADETRKFGEKYNLKGYGKEDNITEETLKQNLLPLLNSQLSNLYENDRRQKYLEKGGNPKLLDLIMSRK